MEKVRRNALVELTRPLIGHVLRACKFARSGAPITAAGLKDELRRILEQIRTDCANNPSLKRDFERLERPLVFFIDYTIKEGGLPFSADWSELARDYNELSGDEKFFDLLADALEDPEAKDRIHAFYLMLGFGFDGCHRGEGDFLERRMRLCATRFPELHRMEAGEFLTPAETAGSRFLRHRRVLAATLAAAVAFAAVALTVNVVRFGSASSDYRSAVFDCLDATQEEVAK